MDESSDSEWIRTVVGRASTLDERICGGLVPTPGPSEEPELRLHRWAQRVAGGDSTLFEQRLSFDRLDRGRAVELLGEMEPAGDAPLPPWADLLTRVSRRMKTHDTPSVQIAEEPIAFEELLADFADEASERLRQRAGKAHARVSALGHQHLRRLLLLTLGWIAGQTLALEFRIARDRTRSRIDRLVRQRRGETSQRLYRAFVAHQRSDGLRALSLEYASLARLLSDVTQMWLDATTEFITRIDTDLAAIADTFFGGESPGPVTEVIGGVSDRHHRGRCVLLVQFESGHRLVYKPRDLAMERAWFRFLDDLNAPLQPRTVKVLVRPGYGWAEFVAAAAAPPRQDVGLYYRRIGGLLAVLHVLGATDCHYENIIASGLQPVLVDGETIMHHAVRRVAPRGFGAQLEAVRHLDRSLLRPGLIPHWSRDANGEARDRSGLASDLPTMSDREFAAFDGVGTDELELRPRRIELPEVSNVPRTAGQRTSVLHHQAAFIEGTRATLVFLAEDHRRVRALLGDFAGSRSRFIFRATSVYASLLEDGNHPDLMRRGVDRSIHFDILGRQREIRDAAPPWWPLLRTEYQALARLDVPTFYAKTESSELQIEGGTTVPGLLEGPSLNAARQRLSHLGPSEIAEQLRLVEASLYSYDIDRTPVDDAVVGPMATPAGPLRPTPNDDFEQEALRIGETLAREAIGAEDGSHTWIGFEHTLGTKRFRLQPISPALYAGSMGVGVFFAALYRATGDERWRQLARGSVSHVVADAVSGGSQRVVTPDHGGVSGVGCIAYAMCLMADYCGDERYLAAARATAGLLTPQLVEADRVFDVCHGSAGTIVGLLPLWSTTGDEEVLDLARRCGEHLVNSRIVDPTTGIRGWASIEHHPLTGMSHGSAGIAMALSRLAVATGRSRYADVAREALEFERAVYIPSARNWPDFRESETTQGQSCMASWCHGAPGIGLARAAMLPSMPDEVAQDIEAAKATTLRLGVGSCDNLCCGNFGRFDTLLTIAEATGDPRLRAQTAELAATAVARAAALGGYDLLPGVPRGLVSPGFFQGLSGIGHMLLRLTAPQRFASVLQWQNLRV